MIEFVSIGAVAVLVLTAFGVAFRLRRWRRDRAQLMRKLSEMATHAQVLQENSSQAIVKFETTGLIRAVNPGAEELFGYSADELLGQNIVKLVVPETIFTARPVRLTETIEMRCKDGTRVRLPFTAARSDLALHSYIYLFFDRGRKDSASKNFREVSGDQISPSQTTLSYAARIIGRVASQYEALLTTINGYSELALLEAPESSALRQELQEIRTASERASSLTQRLVAFSGSQLTPVEPVDLNDLVSDMRDQLCQAVPCAIDFDLRPIGQAALGNVDFLRQMILLLCGSARGRMRDTDRLRVGTHLCDLTSGRKVQSGELKPGAYGVLTISDSGRPLNAQVLERLFEPLAAMHADMGVELSPIYGIVKSLGGGIDVLTGDIGTTFEILLPCVESAKAVST